MYEAKRQTRTMPPLGLSAEVRNNRCCKYLRVCAISKCCISPTIIYNVLDPTKPGEILGQESDQTLAKFEQLLHTLKEQDPAAFENLFEACSPLNRELTPTTIRILAQKHKTLDKRLRNNPDVGRSLVRVFTHKETTRTITGIQIYIQIKSFNSIKAVLNIPEENSDDTPEHALKYDRSCPLGEMCVLL